MPDECAAFLDELEVLFVVDDGPTMHQEQANVARSFVAIGRSLDALTDAQGNPIGFDLRIMVTNTSVEHPGCPVAAAGGAPVATACADRLDDFVDIATDVDEASACAEVCPVPVVPDGPFIRFDTISGSGNLEAPPDMDLDGDGMPESAGTRALACLGPQGVRGCAYGSPLEAMRRALDPTAEWNAGPEPFVRPCAPLLIIFVTDGVDCSGVDAAALEDPASWAVDPATGRPSASEAICWNAGVGCEGPDPNGVFTACSPTPGPLASTSTYAEELSDLRDALRKEVFVMGAVGVPPVTEHAQGAPFQPVAGGFEALVVHAWSEGDLTPGDVAAGTTVADKTFALGIGPGCTGTNDAGEVIGQASPPIRIAEVCQAMNLPAESGDDNAIRCCLESVCDEAYWPTIACVTALFPSKLR